jgi:hypothetical protein
MTIEDALEMAGVSRVEFALIAATTLKQARSLEELASLIATNRRRGLDLLSKQVYFEKFDGTTPSVHVGIDGLRSTAAQTGAYAGSSDPVFRGSYEMLLEDGKTKKAVPAQCLVVVWRLVQGQKCAFEATAFMSEQYPGSGPRGRMFRQWPHRMLATAAERLALRKGFPVELQGLGDHEADADLEGDPPAARTSVTAGMSTAERSALHDQLYREPEELPAPAYVPIRDREVDDAPRLEAVRERYYGLLKDAVDKGLIDKPKEWALPRGAGVAETLKWERELKLTVEQNTAIQAQGSTGPEQFAPGELATPPVPPQDLARSELWAARRQQEIKGGELGVPVRTLNARLATDDLAAEIELTRAQIKAVEEDLVAEANEEPQEVLM